MGTRFELLIADQEDPVRLRAIGEEALGVIHDEHGRLTRFEASSMIAQINRGAGLHAVRVDRELFDLLEESEAIHRESLGTFDIAVGTRATADAVSLDRTHCTVRLASGVQLDLGAIAKGYALDLAASVLREHGVRSALLHGGTSSVIAIGAPPGGLAWGIETPGLGPGSVALRDAALSVSDAGSEVGRVSDPRTSEPIASGWRAGVTGPSARDTDAWATALVVLGASAAAPGGEVERAFTRRGLAAILPELERTSDA